LWSLCFLSLSTSRQLSSPRNADTEYENEAYTKYLQQLEKESGFQDIKELQEEIKKVDDLFLLAALQDQASLSSNPERAEQLEAEEDALKKQFLSMEEERKRLKREKEELKRDNEKLENIEKLHAPLCLPSLE